MSGTQNMAIYGEFQPDWVEYSMNEIIAAIRFGTY